MPDDAASKIYQERLAAECDDAVPLAAVRHVIAASELRTELLYWPPFLFHFFSGALSAMLHRMCALAENRE